MPATTTQQRCIACDNRFDPSNAYGEALEFCSEYCATNFFRCQGCRSIFSHRDRSVRSGNTCRWCLRERFTYTPIGDPPHVGVEVEVESNGEEFDMAYSETLKALPLNFATLKEDGSLSEYGFEIVSRPASYVEHVAAWRPFFAAFRSGKFGRLQAWSTGTCGLHVHICRNGGQPNPFNSPSDIWQLSQHAQALLVCFVNLPRHRDFIQCMAGRDANSYTTFQKKRMATAAQRTGFKYEAVNLEHANTLEFRIFKGTLKEQSFFKAIEFVLALSEFCRATYNVRKALSLSAFIRYVGENASLYPHLDSFIANRWYGKPDRNGGTTWRLINNRKPPRPPVDHGQTRTEGN